MSVAEILEELRRMPEAERRELVAHIENEFAGFDGEFCCGGIPMEHLDGFERVVIEIFADQR